MTWKQYIMRDDPFIFIYLLFNLRRPFSETLFFKRCPGNPVAQIAAKSRNTGASLGSFTCITQHTGPTALRPIRKTKQLWLSVLRKDTSVVTGQAGIRTHILPTPELESNSLDRSATSLLL